MIFFAPVLSATVKYVCGCVIVNFQNSMEKDCELQEVYKMKHTLRASISCRAIEVSDGGMLGLLGEWAAEY